MNMKKFVKKPLAIAVLMLAFGGIVNMAHASSVIQSQDVSASKEVKQGGAFKVEFTASSDEIVSGRQAEDVAVFILKVSDSAEHSGWRLIPTGSSKGGYMYDDSGNSVELHGAHWSWGGVDNNWYKNDSGNDELEEHLYLAKDEMVPPGTYHFTGRVEEYL
ncbi:TPA: MyfA/PsaA family fimbrial adhesin [Yersinia enterocolitica]|uniref:MyfA/PsaA family fimbrial adhesin n=1 Tax=Yersinia enterocolitica TaxID=630 RepID=UPI0029B5EF22|nr:MyfA/PsaA family fimbrial adhesin [Yersinia enterocolitica]HEI6714489.1 MyfA/PsaA family fimbrial adhesin [Yersinia enterocolitica]HEN3512501.1 MyfA/PsaA family fimbrial adhesin [Yersinia enterocolitica]